MERNHYDSTVFSSLLGQNNATALNYQIKLDLKGKKRENERGKEKSEKEKPRAPKKPHHGDFHFFFTSTTLGVCSESMDLWLWMVYFKGELQHCRTA